MAMGHCSWGSGVPSVQKSCQEPHHLSSPRTGRRPHRKAAASLKCVILPATSVVYTATGKVSVNPGISFLTLRQLSRSKLESDRMLIITNSLDIESDDFVEYFNDEL
jgi:hypothetical protein